MSELRFFGLALCIFAFGQSASVMAQRALNKDDIKAHTLYFSIADGFEGEGGDLLSTEIGKAQFIVFGELHNSQQMSLFFNELLHEANRNDFNKLVLEVGPTAGKIVSDLARNGEETQAAISKFLKKYNSKNYRWPIPFIKGVEDARFLQSAGDLDFDIWGIDQEYTLGAEPLFDELLKSTEGSDNYKEVEKAKKDALKSWKSLGRKERGCGALASQEIANYFSYFNSPDTSPIIEDLKKSWEIYCYNDKGEFKKNNQSRVAYMRKNLEERLDQVKDTEGALPKALVKLGTYHAGRVVSPVGVQDVGHLLAEKAKETGTQSLHIRYLRRFWKGKDKLDSKDYSNSRLFLTIGKRDEWAVIDLRPLREKIRAGELTATDWQKFEIFNYDLMLMAPADKWVTNNF